MKSSKDIDNGKKISKAKCVKIHTDIEFCVHRFAWSVFAVRRERKSRLGFCKLEMRGRETQISVRSQSLRIPWVSEIVQNFLTSSDILQFSLRFNYHTIKELLSWYWRRESCANNLCTGTFQGKVFLFVTHSLRKHTRGVCSFKRWGLRMKLIHRISKAC